jgi:hypothetical protein
MVERLAGGDEVESPGTTEAPPEPGDDRRENQFYKSIEDQREAMAKREAEYERGRKEMEPLEKRAFSALNQTLPKPPQLQKPPEPPKEVDMAPDVQGWLGAAALLGILAGVRGRNASTNALTAFGGALEGMKEGNKEKFDRSYKTWKAQSEVVSQSNDQLVSQYKMVLESNKLTSDQKLQQLKLIATINQDKVNEQALRVSGLSEISKNIAQYEYHTAQMTERTRNIDRMITEAREKAEDRKKALELKERELAEKDKKYKAGLMDDEAIDAIARRVVAGSPNALANIGRGAQGSENLSKIHARAAEIAKEQGIAPEDIDQRIAEQFGQRASQRAIGTRAATFALAGQELKEILPTVRTAINNVSRGGVVPVNRAWRAFETGTGSTEEAKLGAALNTLVNVYARAISPTGTGTVSDKEHAREMLNRDMTSAQMHAVLDQMMIEAEAAAKAPAAAKQELRDLAKSGGGAPKERVYNPKTGRLE